jgi:hypothetical protein
VCLLPKELELPLKASVSFLTVRNAHVVGHLAISYLASGVIYTNPRVVDRSKDGCFNVSTYCDVEAFRNVHPLIRNPY